MLPPRKRDALRRFFFTTNTSSLRVGHDRNHPRACVYFCDARKFRGAMLTGTMKVRGDREAKEMIWRDGDTLYYAGGVTDPDYCVLEFTAVAGRYYADFHSETFSP
jgi:general stress protein 26